MENRAPSEFHREEAKSAKKTRRKFLKVLLRVFLRALRFFALKSFWVVRKARPLLLGVH